MTIAGPFARLTFRARLTLQWTVGFGLLLAATGTAIYVGARDYLERDLDRKVRTLARTEAASATDGVAGVHLHEPPIGTLREDDIAPKFAQIFDADRRLVLESHELGYGVGLVPADAIDRALKGDVPIVTVHARARPARVAIVRASSTSREYAVAVGLFTDDNDRFLTSLIRLLAGVWLAGVAATGALGYALASHALKPIAAITARAARIARGDFSMRLDPPALEDEVGLMTRSLNDVLERLYASLDANRRFAADASHELRGPVTAMAGEIDVTLKRPRDADTYRDALVLVRDRLSMMVSIIEDLTMLARVQEGARDLVLQEVPLAPVLGAVVGRFQALAAARRVRVEVEDAWGFIAYADARLLARVLDNVVANAVQYNHNDGRVVVRAALEEHPGDEPAMIVVSVTDTGPGIPPADRERIFDRFYRVDQSRARHTGGTGLGLAICREVAAAMHGSIRVASSGTEGTSIEVRVPGRRREA